MKWSNYQNRVFTELELTDQNLAVIALAGSGKTATIEECNNRVSRGTGVINLAFNKHIEVELRKRLPIHREVATLNALGWRMIREADRGAVLDADKSFKYLQRHFNLDNQDEAKRFYKIVGTVKRAVDLFKQLYLTRFPDNWMEILDLYGIETGDFEEGDELPYWIERVFDYSIHNRRSYDFADQLFQPLFQGMSFKRRDLAFVDESQDLSPVQIELIKRTANRIIAVGDPNQAIYIFRGADLHAIDRIVTELRCLTLPLSICYRCPKAVIREAQAIVPEIEAADGAEEGTVGSVTKSEFRKMVESGDYVTCRNSAPLISECLAFLRLRRKAFVRGRDIGKAIEELIWKVNRRCGSERLNIFLPALNEYHERQTESLMRSGRETESQLLDDRVQSIHAFAEDGAQTIQDVFAVMNTVFSDNNQEGVEFSTIHKSKGLEKPRVFKLRSDLCPAAKCKEHLLPIEYNLRYVEITRSKRELYTILKEG